MCILKTYNRIFEKIFGKQSIEDCWRVHAILVIVIVSIALSSYRCLSTGDILGLIVHVVACICCLVISWGFGYLAGMIKGD